MATAPTPDDVARAILAKFAKNRAQVGFVLQGNNLIGIQAENQFSSDAFTAGLEYAVEQQWIEVADRGGVRLLQAGFDAM